MVFDEQTLRSDSVAYILKHLNIERTGGDDYVIMTTFKQVVFLVSPGFIVAVWKASASVMRDGAKLTDVCIWQIYNRASNRTRWPRLRDLQTGAAVVGVSATFPTTHLVRHILWP